MIIDRIKDVRVIPPRIVTTQVPLRQPREIETTYVVGSGERQIAEGTTGNVLDVSYDELEIDFYSPRDLILYAQQTQVRSA
jgi:hypothetical protein